MKILIRYFSVYRSRFQQDEVLREYPGASSVREIFFSHFQNRDEANRFLKHTRFAVNAEYMPTETILKDGDELVFIPPVSGG